MPTINLSTRPKKKYYTYKQDKCIISITGQKPTDIPTDGGVWYCFFECDAYGKVKGNAEPLYEMKDDKYERITTSSFYHGQNLYTYDGNGKYVEY